MKIRNTLLPSTMIRILILTWIIALGVSCSAIADGENRILFVNSYHKGYEWSDGITRGILSRLKIENVLLKIHYMDSKRNRNPEQINDAVNDVVENIRILKPDLVITSDDIAAKYVIAQHFKDVKLPFVFSGVNWDASQHDLPYPNVTGIEEIAQVSSLTRLLSQHSGGKRIGYLASDSLTGRIDLKYFSKSLNTTFDKMYLVNSTKEWKQRYVQLQDEVDILFMESPAGLPLWDYNDIRQFVISTTKIPTGTTQIWMSGLSLITLGKIPEEQGWWAADAAIKILHGEKPSNIPISQNKDGKLLVNLRLAEVLGITFSQEIIQTAKIVER